MQFCQLLHTIQGEAQRIGVPSVFFQRVIAIRDVFGVIHHTHPGTLIDIWGDKRAF